MRGARHGAIAANSFQVENQTRSWAVGTDGGGVVVVQVVLQNVSRLFPATVDLIAERAVGPDGEVGGCLWAGVTKQQLTLAPDERRTVELSAVFCEPGVFELEVISARVGWGSFASTLLPATSLVVLTPAAVAAPPLGDASSSSIDTSAM